MATQSKTEETNVLKAALDEHGLSEINDNLTKQGFTFEYLSACSSADVDDLCSILDITELLQKLKFKRCLSALDIPKQNQPKMVYSVVTELELQCLRCIERNVQSLQALIASSPSPSQCLPSVEEHKRVINDTFDALVDALNAQRRDSLRTVDSLCEQSTRDWSMLPTCLSELQHIETQCRQLLLSQSHSHSQSESPQQQQPSVMNQERETTMRQLLHAWLSKYEHFQLARDLEVKTVDIEQWKRSFADIVSVRPRETQVVVQALRSAHERPSINGLAYDPSQIDAIEVPQPQPAPSDDFLDVAISPIPWSFENNAAYTFTFQSSSAWSASSQVLAPDKEQAEEPAGWTFEPNLAFANCNNDSNDGDRQLQTNTMHVSCAPMLEFKEQSVVTGHEHETLLHSIPFKRLYVFDAVLAAHGWKERASNSVLAFYECQQTHKVRLVAREQQTLVVRLNHWVPQTHPESNNTAQLCAKRGDVWLWHAMDAADGAMRVFGVRFAGNESAKHAKLFEKVFSFAMLQNAAVQRGLPLPKRIEFDAVVTATTTTVNAEDGTSTKDGGVSANATTSRDSPSTWNFECCARPTTEEQPSLAAPADASPQNDRNEDRDLGAFSFSWSSSNMDENGSSKPSLFFADDDRNCFGEYMENIKNFTADENHASETRTTSIQTQQLSQPQEQDGDNAQCITFAPIVSLREVEVCTGHEQELKLQSFKVRTLYRWGQDVSAAFGWRERASATCLEFYRNKESKQLRMVCREHMTNKLRLNQWVNVEVADMQSSSPLTVKWKAMDATLAKEESDSRNVLGYAMFAARFYDEHTVDAFMDLYQHCEWKQAKKRFDQGLPEYSDDEEGIKVALPRKPIDDKMPKRPPGSWFVFAQAVREQVKSEFPHLPITLIAKEISIKWKALTEEEKKPYAAESARLKGVYEKAMAVYKESGAHDEYQKQLDGWKAECAKRRTDAKKKEER